MEMEFNYKLPEKVTGEQLVEMINLADDGSLSIKVKTYTEHEYFENKGGGVLEEVTSTHSDIYVRKLDIEHKLKVCAVATATVVGIAAIPILLFERDLVEAHLSHEQEYDVLVFEGHISGRDRKLETCLNELVSKVYSRIEDKSEV